jgi:hypothetical protein
MKKGIKTALLSALAVLFILGCENYEGAPVNYDGLNQQNDSTNYNTNGPILRLSAPTIASQNLVASTTPTSIRNEVIIAFTSSDQIEIESFRRAIKIYKIKNAANAWTPYERDGEIGIVEII